MVFVGFSLAFRLASSHHNLLHLILAMLERLAVALNVHLHSIYAFLFIYSFYHITSYVLQLYYYYWQRDRVCEWKCQPNVAPLLGKADAGWIPWLPIFEPFGYKKPGAERFPYGWILSMINMVMGSLCAAVATEGVMRGKSSLLFDDFQWTRDCIGFFLACTLEQVAEYWWHRGMHSATLYSFCHRVHHANRAPSPFDDMLIHPLEGFGYYCILYSPAYLVSMHWYSMCGYMAIMGLCGVIDHSGIKLSVPGIYDSADHDRHHSHYIVNYSFPFPYMDLLFGTFDGEFMGRRIRPWARAGLVLPEKSKSHAK